MSICLPSGVDMPILQKIETAEKIFELFSSRLLKDHVVKNLLTQYEIAVDKSWQAMKDCGIAKQCYSCAVDDGGSCCGKGIEDRFDVALLLLNLLMGSSLPHTPQDPEGCWFLGENGCRIKARHVICVNYLCKRLYKNIDINLILAFQTTMQDETTFSFLLEERIKKILESIR